jgi:hypothetical protein
MSNSLLKAISFSLISSFALISCDKDDDYTPPPAPEIKATVISASGDVTAKLDEFRSILGDSLNNAPGKTSGRREVNWNGVPADLTNNNLFPVDFFNSTDPAVGNGRKRGLVYTNIGQGFRVDSSDLVDIDPSYGAQFDAFSPKKIFIHAGSNVTDAGFKVPGTNTNAFIKGFGVVFSDVDDNNSTYIEFFSGSKSLGVFKAPAKSGNTSFSFLGVFFPEEKVTAVRITAGNGVIAPGVKDISDGGTKDLVVMDDFFYNEPISAQ